MALSVFYSRGATTYDSLGLQSEVASWFPRKSRSDGMRKGHMSPPRGFHSFNGSQPPVKTPGYHLSSLRDASVATCNVQRATCNVQRATCNVQRATCWKIKKCFEHQRQFQFRRISVLTNRDLISRLLHRAAYVFMRTEIHSVRSRPGCRVW